MAQLPKNARRFVGISHYEQDVYTHKPRYQVVHIGLFGEVKDSVEEMARREISTMPVAGEIYRDTLRKNLFIVSESVAKRSYRRAYQASTEDATYEPECDEPGCHAQSVTMVDGLNYCVKHEPSPGY